MPYGPGTQPGPQGEPTWRPGYGPQKPPVPGMSWDDFQSIQQGLVDTVKGMTAAQKKALAAKKARQKKAAAAKRARLAADRSGGGGGGGSPVVQSGIDYAGLAGQVGGKPGNNFAGLNPNVGNLTPLGAAQRGSQTMGKAQLDALVASIVGGTYGKQVSLMQREQERMRGQNASNVANIQRWYGDVMASQGVAAQRDEAFGAAAQASALDTGQGIVEALGGAANEGSYVAGAAAAASAGDISAISAIQNMHNADMAPLLKDEAAGQMTREQGAGSGRLRDLSMKLSELQTEQSSKEAELRYGVWQQNNQVLNDRINRELAIRSGNQALKQQRFANNMGIRTANLAQQAQNAQNLVGLAGVQQDDQQSKQAGMDKAADRAARTAIEAGKEAGRNYRAQLSGAAKSKSQTYATAGKQAKDSAANDILGILKDQDMTPQQAQRLAVSVVSGYGWSVKNPAVAAFVIGTLRAAGIDV